MKTPMPKINQRPTKRAARVHFAFLVFRFSFLVLLQTHASFAESTPSYKITQIPGPESTPLEVGGMDWMPDGRLMVCTRRGDVWSLSGSQWKLYASGLQEALGFVHGDKGAVFVMQRPELPHLVDSKGSGAADRPQPVTTNFGSSGNTH